MSTLNDFNILAMLRGSFVSSGTLNEHSERIDIAHTQALTNGNTAATANANQVWTDSRTLVATSENLTLTGSELTDVFGVGIEFTAVKVILIKNTSTVSGEDLLLSGGFMELGVLDGTSPKIILPPGGVYLHSSPIDGFATGSSKLNVDAQSDTITYEIALIGTIA